MPDSTFQDILVDTCAITEAGVCMPGGVGCISGELPGKLRFTLAVLVIRIRLNANFLQERIELAVAPVLFVPKTSFAIGWRVVDANLASVLKIEGRRFYNTRAVLDTSMPDHTTHEPYQNILDKMADDGLSQSMLEKERTLISKLYRTAIGWRVVDANLASVLKIFVFEVQQLIDTNSTGQKSNYHLPRGSVLLAQNQRYLFIREDFTFRGFAPLDFQNMRMPPLWKTAHFFQMAKEVFGT